MNDDTSTTDDVTDSTQDSILYAPEFDSWDLSDSFVEVYRNEELITTLPYIVDDDTPA